MGASREGGSESVKKKKKHKRKYEEFGAVGGEDGNVEVDDRGRMKKSKVEGFGDARVPENNLDLVSNVNADYRSKKDKNKKGKGEVIGEDQKSEKRKRKEKGSKGGDEGGVSYELGAQDGMRNSEESVGRGGFNGEKTRNSELLNGRDEHVREEGEVKKVKKKKKGKVTLDVLQADSKGREDMVEGTGFAGIEIVHDVTEKEVKPVDKKKKKQKKEKKNDGVTDEVDPPEDEKQKKEKDMDEVVERIEHVKDKKQKKKTKKKKEEKHCAASTNDENELTKGSEIGKSVASATVKDADARNDSADAIEKSNMRKGSKKVKFVDNVEYFPVSNDSGEENLVDGSNLSEGKDGSNSSEGEEDLAYGGYSSEGEEDLGNGKSSKRKKLKVGRVLKSPDGLVPGKRFSKEGDEILRSAVLEYVGDHRLGEEGVEMVMKCRQHRKKVKGCWKEIAKALPWRTREAIYCRAHVLFERSENRKWTKEELEMVRDFHQKHGPKWRELADELGRHRVHVKDAFRQVKLPNKKTGHWSQEEYQTLFNLVNQDLRLKIFMDKKSKHGMLRDNIGWEAISRELETRTDPLCCSKWYDQLTSPLVGRGEWADADDYRLLIALVDLDASCEEEVDWDNLVELRSGDVCRKRWYEMVRHIGEHGIKSFSEQVDILSQRYCPDVLEAREIYDSKPVVD